MTAVLTPEERLGHADEELLDLKNGFVEAIVQLQEHPGVDGSFDERLRSVAARLRALRRELRPEDFDKEQIAEFHGALWEVNDLLGEREGTPDLDVVDGLLIGIERVRHVIRDALDQHVVGLPDDAGSIVKEVKARLPNTSNEVIGRLVGVDRRTLSRWGKQKRAPTPRLRLVARLVAILRHNWTEEGIVAWFERPRRGLDGEKPISLLDDPAAEDRLLSEARAGRSQDA